MRKITCLGNVDPVLYLKIFSIQIKKVFIVYKLQNICIFLLKFQCYASLSEWVYHHFSG